MSNLFKLCSGRGRTTVCSLHHVSKPCWPYSVSIQPPRPKPRRTKSVHWYVNTIFPSLAKRFSASPFPTTDALSFHVILNAKQPEIAEGRKNDESSTLQITSQISVPLWMAVLPGRILRLTVDQVLQNSLSTTPLYSKLKRGRGRSTQTDQMILLFPSLFPCYTRVNCIIGYCIII